MVLSPGHSRLSKLMDVCALDTTCRFKKTAAKVKIPGKGGLRWYKNVGLGFKTPKDAIEGACEQQPSHSQCCRYREQQPPSAWSTQCQLCSTAAVAVALMLLQQCWRSRLIDAREAGRSSWEACSGQAGAAAACGTAVLPLGAACCSASVGVELMPAVSSLLPSQQLSATTVCICVLPLSCAGNYIDKKCPFTGNVSIRGRILTGEQQPSSNQTQLPGENWKHAAAAKAGLTAPGAAGAGAGSSCCETCAQQVAAVCCGWLCTGHSSTSTRADSGWQQQQQQQLPDRLASGGSSCLLRTRVHRQHGRQ